jgi:hypothetical protein
MALIDLLHLACFCEQSRSVLLIQEKSYLPYFVLMSSALDASPSPAQFIAVIVVV